MKVLITGVSGFLGRFVAERLVRDGHEAIGFDLVEPKVALKEFVKGDFTSPTELADALLGVDQVCHLGGVGDVYLAEHSPELAFRMNAYGTLRVCEACVSNSVTGLIHASTWEVYGKPLYQPIDESHPCNPGGTYSISKLASELIARNAGGTGNVNVMVLRLGTAYGSSMRETAVIPRFIQRAIEGKPLTIFGEGTQFRQFTHARDIASAFSLAVSSSRPNKLYNIVADEKVTLLSLATQIASRYGVPIEYRAARKDEPTSALVSSHLAKEELRWTPSVTFERGLKEIINTSGRFTGRTQGAMPS